MTDTFNLDIISRIKSIVEANGESLSIAAINSGHSKNYFSQLKILNLPVDLKTLLYVKEKFDVSLDYIVYGNSEIKEDNKEILEAFIRLQDIKEEYSQKIILAALVASLNEYDRIKLGKKVENLEVEEDITSL